MELYKTLYFKLFGKLADAIELLERGQALEAKHLLIQAEQEAEELYLQSEEQ